MATRYADVEGISPSLPYLALPYLKAHGVEWDAVLGNAKELSYNDTVITGPWSDWSWLPAYINIEVVPDGTGPTQREAPLRSALRQRGLPSAYALHPPKTRRAKGYEAYFEAKRWAEEMEAHFALRPRIEVGKSVPPHAVVSEASEARRVLAHLMQQPRAAFDFETDHLNPRLITRRALALADEQMSWYITDEVAGALRPEISAFLRTHPHLSASNSKYDLAVQAAWDEDVPTAYAPVWDTQVEDWLLNPDGFQHGLKYITKKTLKRDVLALQDLGGPEAFWELPHATQALYAAAGDARNSFDLDVLYEEQLRQRNLLDLYLRVEQPVTPVLAEMEAEGLPLGRARLVELAWEYEERGQGIIAELGALGFHGNANADAQIVRFLFGELGLPVLVQTPTTKQPSVALDVLRQLRLRLEGIVGAERGLRAVQLFIEWSEVDKAKSTFLLPPLEAGLSTFFFALQQTAVKTGRLSTKPNAQNWPSKIQDICEAEEGWELTDADFGQIEPRIAAHLSQDPRMLSVFRGELGDIDTYQSLGMDMGFPLERLGKHSDLRKNIKTVYLAEQYGGSAPKIQLIALRQGEFIPLTQCRALQDGIHRARPVFYAWRQAYVQRTRRGGGIVTDPLFQRTRDVRRQLNAIDPGSRDAGEREVMNWPMQSGAGSVIKLAMPGAQRLFREAGGSMINMIHDELLGKTPKLSQAQRVEFDVELARRMESVVELSVPLLAEVGSGRTWRAAKNG